MTKQIKTVTLDAEVAKRAGFAEFNAGPHLCLFATGEEFTISVRTPTGKKITFAFIPGGKGRDDYECVDVDFRNSGLPTVANGDVQLSPFHVVGFAKGGDSFDTRKLERKPSLITVLLGKHHYAAKP